MTVNRYAVLKLGGAGPKGLAKRVWLSLWCRPHANRLGRDTYAQRPFRCNAPDRMTIGNRCTIGRGARLQLLTQWFEQRFDPRIVIGNDVYVGVNCEFVSVSGIQIEDGCTLSDNVYINDSSHGLDPRDGLLMDRPLTTKGQVRIGAGSFIGRGAMVLPGVTLGRGCVVGAGAIVTRSAPDFTLLAGNPARPVSHFDLDTGTWQRYPAGDCP